MFVVGRLLRWIVMVIVGVVAVLLVVVLKVMVTRGVWVFGVVVVCWLL